MNSMSSVVDSFLFHGVERNLIDRAMLTSSRAAYEKGAVIYTPENYSRSLGFVVRGKVRVAKEALVLNILNVGDVFGAAALFSERGDYATTLSAFTECEVVFLPQETVQILLFESNAFVENYVRYLSGRIQFLSTRLDAVSAGTVERKVAQYLLGNADEDMSVSISATCLARRLSISRASLYRAFDVLEKDNAIARDHKCIRIVDITKLQDN